MIITNMPLDDVWLQEIVEMDAAYFGVAAGLLCQW
jgi:hypothetical protein